ncbi:hypothetical protein ThvES_00020320 [Thiovulum sp. ES]|nr:hypothetical protein ThvES_00020320 [Thiovulum sp. ES]
MNYRNLNLTVKSDVDIITKALKGIEHSIESLNFENSLTLSFINYTLIDERYLTVTEGSSNLTISRKVLISAIITLDGQVVEGQEKLDILKELGITKYKLNLDLVNISAGKSKWHTFYYEANEDFINLKGKQFHTFRRALKYLTESDRHPHISIKHYTNKDINTSELEKAIIDAKTCLASWITVYKDKKASHLKVVLNSMKLFQYIDFYFSVIYYKDEPITFLVSDKLTDDFISLTDAKVNKTLSKDILSKYAHSSKVMHYLHMKYWYERNDKKVTRYVSGNADVGSTLYQAKQQLKPYIVSPERFKTLKIFKPSKKARSLF